MFGFAGSANWPNANGFFAGECRAQNEHVARHAVAHKQRWRDRPRTTVLRWDLDRGYGLFVILMGVAWWSAAAYGYAALTGHADPSGGDSRWKSAIVALVALAVAIGSTRLAWLFLRRPVAKKRD